MMNSSFRFVPVVVTLVLSSTVPAFAAPASKCEALKMKAAGKKTYSQAKCYQKSFTTGDPVDAACLGKAQTKFVDAIAKADTFGPCPGANLDQATEDCVDSFVDSVTPTTTTTTTSTTSTTLAQTPILLHWTFDNTLANTGELAGYAFSAPSGISFGAGKVGQAAIFGLNQWLEVSAMKTALGSLPDVTIAFWANENGSMSGPLYHLRNASSAPYGGTQVNVSTNLASICVATSSNANVGGSCIPIGMPSVNNWHHWIIRYDGTGTGAGQGGNVETYVDDVLMQTRNNDGANDPVYNPGIPDTMFAGAQNLQLDDFRIYDQVFTRADQCTLIIGGSWNGSTCTLP